MKIPRIGRLAVATASLLIPFSGLASPAGAAPTAPPAAVAAAATPTAASTVQVIDEVITSTQATPALQAVKPKTSNKKPAWYTDTISIQPHGVHKRWPLKEAAKRMSAGSPVKMQVVKTCKLGDPCIHVRDVENIKGKGTKKDWVAVTHIGTWDDGFIASVNIDFENSWGRHASYNERLNTTMHEFGHGLGMDHSSSKSSVMYKYVSNALHLSAGDKKWLNKHY